MSKNLPTNATQWIDYRNNYEKKWYDLWLMSGEVIIHCYPNAGTFHCDKDGRVIDGEEVYKFKLSERQWEY